jgi:hypothetical protein
MPPETKRTNQQSRALHKFFELKATQCRDAGVSPRMAFEKTIELEMTPQLMKEIWRSVQRAMYGKQSTTELAKVGEIDEVAEHINRFFATHFSLPGLDFPSHALGYADTAPLKEDPTNNTNKH